jgi:CheY-like chemotaxis protein
LNQIAQEAIQSTQPHWRDAIRSQGIKLELTIDFDPDLPRIMGKGGELREAVAHLIVNAIQAMPRGGLLTLRTLVHPAQTARAGETPGQNAILETIDTGVGMDAETRKRCLEPFFSTKSHQGAKGLGLSHVFGIMQRHGGALEIESEPGKGTLMRLIFPATQTAAVEPPVFSTDDAKPVSLKVLCIDDQQSILDVLKIILQSAGHKVETALEGHAGLDAFRAARSLKDPFAAVITDLGMPGMDGRQVAKIIKQESSTPVIMLTGWGDIMQAEGNHPEHIDAIISKPPGANQLLEILRKVAAKTPK